MKVKDILEVIGGYYVLRDIDTLDDITDVMTGRQVELEPYLESEVVRVHSGIDHEMASLSTYAPRAIYMIIYIRGV